jgi:hypothetical protein
VTFVLEEVPQIEKRVLDLLNFTLREVAFRQNHLASCDDELNLGSDDCVHDKEKGGGWGGNTRVASSLFRRLGEEDVMQMNAGKCRISLAVE